jgi:hypothetical protein
MSDFLMVVPEGWIAADMGVISTMLDEVSLAYAAENEPATIEEFLEQTGQMPVNSTVVEARLFKNGGSFSMWFRVVDRVDM